tara:strand:- start:208 stop:426 length:219 start_codon:yes stop_codon:yes gene_type:complete
MEFGKIAKDHLRKAICDGCIDSMVYDEYGCRRFIVIEIKDLACSEYRGVFTSVVNVRPHQSIGLTSRKKMST